MPGEDGSACPLRAGPQAGSPATLHGSRSCPPRMPAPRSGCAGQDGRLPADATAKRQKGRANGARHPAAGGPASRADEGNSPKGAASNAPTAENIALGVDSKSRDFFWAARIKYASEARLAGVRCSLPGPSALEGPPKSRRPHPEHRKGPLSKAKRPSGGIQGCRCLKAVDFRRSPG